MARYTGKLELGDQGLTIHTAISAGNAQEFTIPLQELFDDLIGSEVTIEINRVVPFAGDPSPAGGSPND